MDKLDYQAHHYGVSVNPIVDYSHRVARSVPRSLSSGDHFEPKSTRQMGRRRYDRDLGLWVLPEPEEWRGPPPSRQRAFPPIPEFVPGHVHGHGLAALAGAFGVRATFRDKMTGESLVTGRFASERAAHAYAQALARSQRVSRHDVRVDFRA